MGSDDNNGASHTSPYPQSFQSAAVDYYLIDSRIPPGRVTSTNQQTNTPTPINPHTKHTSTPAHQHANTPTHQHTNKPSQQHTNTPTHQRTSTPTNHHTN